MHTIQQSITQYETFLAEFTTFIRSPLLSGVCSVSKTLLDTTQSLLEICQFISYFVWTVIIGRNVSRKIVKKYTNHDF